MFYFSMKELTNQLSTEISLAISLMFMMSSGLGFWTIALHLFVQFSDPGIVLPLKDDFTTGFKMHCMDLDE